MAVRSRFSASLSPRASARNRHASIGERAPLHCIHRLPMATIAEGFPPYSTVQGYFYTWSRNGTFASLNHALVMAAREAAGRGRARRQE